MNRVQLLGAAVTAGVVGVWVGLRLPDLLAVRASRRAGRTGRPLEIWEQDRHGAVSTRRAS